MKENLVVFRNSRSSILVLGLSIFVSAFWLIFQLINKYHNVLTGVVFEILWLPMIMLLFIIPIVSLVFWVKEKFHPRSFYFYSILIIIITILYMFTRDYN
jgi:hypothetical protein